MVAVTGGRFTMGSDDFYPEERPSHLVDVGAFAIDAHPVTNGQFALFVADTGYVTTAEIAPRAEDYPGALPELLVAGAAVFVPPPRPVDLSDPGQWWVWGAGAQWRHPTGPGSSIEGRDDHPVVQVSYADASTYAEWADKSLPTEAQWEFAARGGVDNAPWAWGAQKLVSGRVPANVWQGDFPHRSSRDGGEWGTVPIGTYPANGFGLHDVCGQVWEWTSDLWAPAHEVKGPCCSPPVDPVGPTQAGFDPQAPTVEQRVIKGGSYLCADNYCMRYRPSARIAESVDTSTCHLGFRCVRN